MRNLLLLPFIILACDDSKDDTSIETSTTDTTTTTTEEEEPPSNYTSGSYHITTLVLLDSKQGFDLDGDGTINNKLPEILPMIDMMLEEDISLEGLNSTMEESVSTDTLILLLKAVYQDLVLDYDLLQGVSDSGTYQVDEASYDENGVAYSHFTGVFLDETSYEVTADTIKIPVTFYAGEPPLYIPLAESVATGSLSVNADGMIGGAIPVEDMIDQVVAPLIPEEGFDGKTKEEWLTTIENLANSEYMSDIELSNGQRAISAALSFSAEPL